MPEIERVAVERGFELITCKVDDSQEDRDAAGKSCLEFMEALAAEADAIYLTVLLSLDEQLEPVIELLFDSAFNWLIYLAFPRFVEQQTRNPSPGDPLHPSLFT